MKFYYRARSQPKRLQIEKLVERDHFLIWQLTRGEDIFEKFAEF